ncbi:hypothetical protein evm_006929 [Chilo suppressalis]|nr:hypothetical protein evm_006929 [Chilo suppressalis]
MDSDVSSGSSGGFAWGHTVTSHDSDSSDSTICTPNKRINSVKEDDENALNQNIENFNKQKTKQNKNKRKMDSKSELSDSEHLMHSPKRKKIKKEEIEDTDNRKKKSKKKDKKRQETESVEENFEIDVKDETDIDYEYLNEKVKEEKELNESNKLQKSYSELDSTPDKVKKQKKRKSKSSPKQNKKYDGDDNSEVQFEVEDKFYAEETIVQETVSDSPFQLKHERNKLKYTYYESNEDEHEQVLNMKVKKEKELNESIKLQSSYSKLDSSSDKLKKEKKRNSKSSPKKNKKYDGDDNSEVEFKVEDKFYAEETIVQETVSDSPFQLKHERNKLKNTHYESHDEEHKQGLNMKVKKKKELNESIKLQSSYSKLDSTPDKLKKEKKQKSKSSPKKNKNNIAGDSSEIEYEVEDKFYAEETIVHKPRSDSTSQLNHNGNNTDNESNEEQYKQGLNSYTESNFNNLTQDDSDEVVESKQNFVTKSIPSTPKINERLIFEEYSDPGNLKKLNHFLKENLSLKPVLNKLLKEQEITEDDEIWIIKCPHDLDVINFRDKDITIDHKSKMKINGETYNGTLDETIVNATVVSGEVIKNVKINGVATFRKRLPKPHAVENNVMISNQTDFIPLPETKCRHPLFGADYKKYLEMSMSAVQRLKESSDQGKSSMERKKKKHRKEHNVDESLDNALEIQTHSESETPRKKAKKRKHSNDIPVKKAKRIKQEIDSSDVWESEKAIEENLFNF